ncbi:MAG: RES family NAD+ phosphorylase [Acidovorax sp.]|uniref:RES family NAD+ phosphorylase n=1 Tax=Acidovorax sp. TaxID=1872122 RepID=UPI0039E44EA1
MPCLWRIAADTPDYTANDLSGAGAEKTGGRWNRKGQPVVYAASSIALAALETIVHLGAGALPLNRYLVRIDVPEGVWNARATGFAPARHVGWDARPPGQVSLDYGDAWLQGLASALLELPSVIVPEESNVLINPRHPDARRLTATKLRLWQYDQRMR